MQVATETSNAAWNVKDILKIIDSKIEAYEISSLISKSMPKVSERGRIPARMQGTTKSFKARQEIRQERVERKLQCYFCKGSHVVGKCDKVTSVEERRKIL